MLERLRHETLPDAQTPVRLAEADVLEPPPDWQGYDLIVSCRVVGDA
jgi:hypothetical protein